MAHTQDEIQSRNNETQSAAGWDERGVSPPTLEPARLQPPTHPALPRVGTGRLRFAPAPADRNGEPAAPARRLRRTNWVERVFEAGWMALALGCAGECVYRLLWAVGR